MTDFDFAVSFAGEDREYVAGIVAKLKDRDASVFYDLDHVSEIWGENVVDFLQAVYARQARFAIVFVSRHYVDNVWTRYERQSAQDRALQQSSPYLLPVRLDDTDLPGLHSTIGYLDAREIGVDGIVEAAMRKLGRARTEPVPRFNGRTPRTSEEIAVLLGERPPGWEHLLYAAVIKQGMDAMEEKYRDHLLEYARRNGRYVPEEEGVDSLQRNFANLGELTNSFERILDARVQEAAFGRPGEPGDPDRIIHLARRFVSVYEDLLDWSAEIRGTGAATAAIRRLLDNEARWTDQPIGEMRQFVDGMVREMDTLTERLEAGENIELEIVIKFDVGAELVAQHDLAVAEYQRGLGL
jgi:hypothetical protein